MTQTRRWISTLTLVAALAALLWAPAGHAAPAGDRSSWTPFGGFWTSFMESVEIWAARLGEAPSAVRAASTMQPGWDPNGASSDKGLGLDPDGVTGGPGWDPNGVTGDDTSHLDPDGLMLGPALDPNGNSAEIGPALDPNGGSADLGSTLDPDG